MIEMKETHLIIRSTDMGVRGPGLRMRPAAASRESPIGSIAMETEVLDDTELARGAFLPGLSLRLPNSRLRSARSFNESTPHFPRHGALARAFGT